MYEYQNFKLFLQMPIFQIGLKKFLWLKNLKKNIFSWTYVVSNLNEEEMFGTFYEKELQETNQNEFRLKKEKRHKL